ncbi:MAG: PC4/YdbC family ssDNA-binding protein [Anaerovoracaceae bacterium]|nr:PC4/YdbC family ssDNA-binding protein [Anaerovoracaceae bacterium]
MSGIKFEIVEHITTISERGKWTLELNRVSWNGNPPKLDLRSWSEDHEKCSKGINLTHDEALALREVLDRIV